MASLLSWVRGESAFNALIALSASREARIRPNASQGAFAAFVAAVQSAGKAAGRDFERELPAIGVAAIA